jgi:ABC-type transport system substrate-binding protein
VPADAFEFVDSDDVQLVHYERWYQFMIAFNSNVPQLRPAVVRRAINMAVNRAALVDGVLRGRASASSGPIWPKYWAYDESVPGYDFDPAAAEALLEQAGYRVTAAPNTDAPPARLRFVCLIPENFIVLERIALHVQRDLLAVGVDMQVEVLPFEEIQDRLDTRRFEAVLGICGGRSSARPPRGATLAATTPTSRGKRPIARKSWHRRRGARLPRARRSNESAVRTDGTATEGDGAWKLRPFSMRRDVPGVRPASWSWRVG